MGDWLQSRNYKGAESTRALNKREERRLELEVESKHGIKAIHEFSLEEIEKEKRLIQKELERIRYNANRRHFGTHVGPVPEKKVNDENIINQKRKRASKSNIIVNARLLINRATVDDDVIQNGGSNILRRYDHFGPRPLGLQSSDNNEEDRRNEVPRGGFTIHKKLSLPSYARRDERYKILLGERGTALPPVNVEERGRGMEFISETDSEPAIRLLGHGERNTKPRLKPRSVRVESTQSVSSSTKQADLFSLGSLNMTTIKGNISKRLSAQNITGENKTMANPTPVVRKSAEMPSAPNSREKRQPTPAKNTSNANVKDATPVRKTSKSSENQLNIEGPLLGPDGTLRTVHQIPESDKAWDEAKKARYIRTRDLMERDRELSITEIFDQADTDSSFSTQ